MQADAASNANVEAQSLSYHSQNTAIITESTSEIKSHGTSPALPVAKLPDRGQPPLALPVVSLPRGSQAKGGSDTLPQGAFLLNAD